MFSDLLAPWFSPQSGLLSSSSSLLVGLMVDGADPTDLLEEKRACWFHGYLLQADFYGCLLATRAGVLWLPTCARYRVPASSVIAAERKFNYTNHV